MDNTDDLNEVLDIVQRQKRAMILRAHKQKIERARELAKKRLAPEKNIKKRAYAQARQIVRSRFAGQRGAEYEKLGPSEKMAVDRAIEKKGALIKRIALRLIPRVKQAEAKRLQSFVKGQAMQNLGASERKSPVNESLNALFEQEMGDVQMSPKTDKEKMDKREAKKKSPIVQYSKFSEESDSVSPVYMAIAKKAGKAGIDIDILGEVYDRGMAAWDPDMNVSQQQYAFARVNSYINQGKTYFNEDADLHEGREPREGKIVRYKRPDGSTALKSLNKWGKRKDWRDSEGGLKAAQAHAGVDKVHEDVQIDEMGGDQHYSDTRGATSGGAKGTPITRKQATKDVTATLNKAFKKEVQQTNENFIDGKGPGKPGDAARHGLKGKSAAELKKIRSSETASPRKKQLAHWMLNMHHNEEAELEEKRGLWDNIHAKRKRIAAGSGERMRKPGSKGAPTAQNFRDASESIEEGYDVNSKHYKALTDLDLNTKNRDMTTKHDGYGPLNPMDTKGSKKFWEDKAKMWNTTVEAAMEARCRNCAAFNQAPAIMKKMAEGLGPAGEKIQDLANLGFCELFEFKCAGDRTCNKWLVNGPITEEDTANGTKLVDKESTNSKARKKLEVVDRKPPHTEYTRQAEIKTKIIDEEGNSQPDPKKRLVGTDSLVKAYKKDTPGQGDDLNESFNIAYAAGVGVTLTAADLGMKTQGAFAYHPSVIEEIERRAKEQEEVEEEVRSADFKGVVVRTAAGKTVVRKQKANRKIIGTGNLTDGKPDDTL